MVFEDVVDHIQDALASAVTGRPELQVFRAVVFAVPVFMMNGLVPRKRPANHCFHDDAVLKARVAAY